MVYGLWFMVYKTVYGFILEMKELVLITELRMLMILGLSSIKLNY